jgi:cobalt-zinc-cadmium resistance protein CzcA
LDRTNLVEATIKTVSKNLGEGALLVIAVLFLLLRQFQGCNYYGSHYSFHNAHDRNRHGSKGISANLMSLGALDLVFLSMVVLLSSKTACGVCPKAA